MTFVVICAILYFVYTRFLSGTPHQQDAPPPYSAEPPPPGFRPEYTTPPCGDNLTEYLVLSFALTMCRKYINQKITQNTFIWQLVLRAKQSQY